MLILTWIGIIFVIILARCKIMTNIMPTHVKISRARHPRVISILTGHLR